MSRAATTSFLDAYLAEQGEALPDTAGELVTTNGEVIGEHGGIHNFTVGQRKGLGVATGSPLYVIQIKGDARQVIVGGEERTLFADLAGAPLEPDFCGRSPEPMRVSVKIRHRHQAAPARYRADRAPTKSWLPSTNRSARSRRARRLFSTTAMWSWAAAGSCDELVLWWQIFLRQLHPK